MIAVWGCLHSVLRGLYGITTKANVNMEQPLRNSDVEHEKRSGRYVACMHMCNENRKLIVFFVFFLHEVHGF